LVDDQLEMDFSALVVVSAARTLEVEASAGRPRVRTALARLKPRPPVRETRTSAGTVIKDQFPQAVQAELCITGRGVAMPHPVGIVQRRACFFLRSTCRLRKGL